MVITKPVCDICGSTESIGWMCQGAYQSCNKCFKDISLFESQPFKNDNIKMLLEVFCRSDTIDTDLTSKTLIITLLGVND